MAMLLESNTLLLVNVADGAAGEPPALPQYRIYIVYSEYSNGVDLNGQPSFSQEVNNYIGFYVGPEEEDYPKDPTLYNWSKYSSDSTYIDIRYSDSKGSVKELTVDSNGIPNGLTPGAWMGVLTTSNPIVLNPDWYPSYETEITPNDYIWTEIQSDGIVYYFDYDYGGKAADIFKFYSTQQTYSYTPKTFTIYARSRRGSNITTLDQARMICKIYHSYITTENGKDIEVIDVLAQRESSNGQLTFDLNNYATSCIEFLEISCYPNVNSKPFTEVKNIPFGTKKEMAQLSLNAADIVASIQNTKLIFNTNGLTVKNGGFKILNKDNAEVFYTDESGNLTLSGKIVSTVGEIGGWVISEDELFCQEKLDKNQIENNIVPKKFVGLYTGNEKKLHHYEENSPIRIWANEYEVQENGSTYNDYAFALTEDGYLYSTKAKIEGTIIAKNGYIENLFYIGKDPESRIVIKGGTDESPNSYIGSGVFNSGVLGYGWKISQDGTAEFDNIIARGKIQSSVFEYDKISSVGGSLYIAPTIYTEVESGTIQGVSLIEETEENTIVELTVSWTLPYKTKTENGKTVLENVNGRDWNINDEIKLDGAILTNSQRIEFSDIDGTITNFSIDPSNSNCSIVTISIYVSQVKSNSLIGQKFLPGTIIILYGSEERRHGLYLTAAGGSSPYLDVYDDSENNQIKPAVRIGNLSGINDSNFPVTEFGYGLYSSNAYLRGQLMLPGAGITNQNTYEYGSGENSSPIRIWAGLKQTEDITKYDIRKANFIVTENGYMYAKQGIFEGTVIATNSEFSGSIKAAGIVVDDPKTTEALEASLDHFFVGYKENPNNFNDYILDINSKGISIWEGGLRAYSDRAGELLNDNQTPFDTIYGYKEDVYENPLPYFYLVDEKNKELDSRIVANKAHFLKINYGESSNYKANSVIIDDGIWFGSKECNDKTTAETDIFENNLKQNGLSFSSNRLKIASNTNINLNTGTLSTFYVGAIEEDIKERNAKMFIRGQLELVNQDLDNLISLNGQIIKEAKIGEQSIGIDIIIAS